MAVAKSYEKFQQIGEPYEQNGKKYVDMIGTCPRCGGSGNYSYNPKDGTTCYGCGGTGKIRMMVRWYSDAARATMDRAAEKREKEKKERLEAKAAYKNGPEGNGFGVEEGYITMLLGNSYPVKDELKAAGCRYNNIFGWYIPYDVDYEVPQEYNLKEVRINWSDISENGRIKSMDEVQKVVKSMTTEESCSEYQGEIGEKITVQVEVTGNHPYEGRYGTGVVHTFEDENGNVYVWTTSSKSIEVGNVITLTGTVKDHTEYRNVKQTVLTRCKVSYID